MLDIRVNNPTLNRNVGKYNLHHIWESILFNTPDLKINNDNGHACTEHPSVGMLSPFQPTGICIELRGILDMLLIQSMHTEHPKTNI